MNFNPFNWYWLASDGRVYSSAAQSTVASNDAAFGEWKGAGNRPTLWPSDAAGNQTNDALQAVLNDYGLFVDLVAYAADRRWRKEIGGITVSGVPVATDDRSKQMIMGARIAADKDANFSTPWVGADGNVYTLTGAQVIGISDAVLTHVATCFATFASVKQQVAAGTITTRDQVDAAFA